MRIFMDHFLFVFFASTDSRFLNILLIVAYKKKMQAKKKKGLEKCVGKVNNQSLI